MPSIDVNQSFHFLLREAERDILALYATEHLVKDPRAHPVRRPGCPTPRAPSSPFSRRQFGRFPPIGGLDLVIVNVQPDRKEKRQTDGHDRDAQNDLAVKTEQFQKLFADSPNAGKVCLLLLL